MIPVKMIDPEDLPLYAMRLLSPGEMDELTLQLQHSVEARRVLGEIYGELTILANTAEMHAPPASTRERLMQVVRGEKKTPAADPLDRFAPVPVDTIAPRTMPAPLLEEEPVRRSALSQALPWVGWALAAGAGGFAFLEYQQETQLRQAAAANTAEMHRAAERAQVANSVLETMRDPEAVHVELTGANVKPQPTGRVTYVANRGSLLFLASNLEPLQPAKAYELWLIPADGRDPMPAGVFKPDEHGNASVVLPELPKGVEAKAFGVTIEDADGSAVPTLPILLKGQPS